MIDYKRLTKREHNRVIYVKPLTNNYIGAIYEEQKEREKEIIFRLAELEDKIECGELCEQKTCQNVSKKHPVDEFICSECGFHYEDVSETKYDEDGEYFYKVEFETKYCPNCGAKVEE